VSARLRRELPVESKLLALSSSLTAPLVEQWQAAAPGDRAPKPYVTVVSAAQGQQSQNWGLAELMTTEDSEVNSEVITLSSTNSSRKNGGSILLCSNWFSQVINNKLASSRCNQLQEVYLVWGCLLSSQWPAWTS